MSARSIAGRPAGAGRARRALAWSVALLVASALGARAATPPARPADRGATARMESAAPPESAPLRTIEGGSYLGAGDLARLLSATRFWRSDVRRLVLRAGAHRIVLTVDNPFVLVDDHTVRLRAPARVLGGELFVPAELIDALPRDGALARLVVEPGRALVVVVPPDGLVGAPRVTAAGEITRVTIACEHPARVQVTGRARARFRVRLPGSFVGVLTEPLPPAALVTRVTPGTSATGTLFEFRLRPGTSGFRVIADSVARRLTLEFARVPLAGLESFAAEGPAGPRAVRVVMLDPAHGGAESGVQAGGLAEKDLTLALALALRPELERRLGARVLLTRTDDRAISTEARAEAANRAHSDLVLVLHMDGNPAPAGRGATAYCPPATLAPQRAGAGAAGFAVLEVVPWRDVALRHAVDSRALADAVLESLAGRGWGPVRLREILPLHLLGVNAPGIALECATLTSEADRARLAAPAGIASLATAIAEGVAAWQRNE